MARIKIIFPKKILATINIPVRITDINYGNHLGNSNVVEIIHEARMQFLQSHSYSELNAGGISLIMSDLQVEYKSESYYGDNLAIKIFAGDVSRVSFELLYQVVTNRGDKTIIIANAKTGLVGYDYNLKKVVALTPDLLSILSAS